MKILLDIGHPAHVHYFKNFIKIMEDKGHQFLITSRNKEIEHHLLKQYKIAFKSRGCRITRTLDLTAHTLRDTYLSSSFFHLEK